MKKLSLALLVLIAGCTPYQLMNEPVTMNYAVNIYTNGKFDGVILCRDIVFKGDTTTLIDAGYYVNRILQRRVAEVRLIGKKEFMIVQPRPYRMVK